MEVLDVFEEDMVSLMSLCMSVVLLAPGIIERLILSYCTLQLKVAYLLFQLENEILLFLKLLFEIRA